MEIVAIGQQAFGIVAIGQEARGVIAIGQIATGFIAIGQMATGFIAIGQIARGVFALGMAAIGLVPVGMLSLGVFVAHGLLGAAAVRGKGAVLPLMPFPRLDPYRTQSVDAIARSGRPGFASVGLAVGADRVPRVTDENDRALPVRVATELFAAARAHAVVAGPRVVAYVVPHANGELVAERLIARPVGSRSVIAELVRAVPSILALCAVIAGFYALVVLPLVELAAALS